MSKITAQNLLLLCLAAGALSGCLAPVAGLALAGGATVGIATERQGGLSAAATDARIKALIADKWFKYNVETFAKLNLTVDHTRVLITGIVQSPDARVQAVRLAWQVDGVTEVNNEIRIADSQSFSGHATDVWITTRLRAEMTFDKDVRAIDYSIDTVDGTVYLMGIANNKEEAAYVVQIARDIPHVKQVISYIKISDDAQAGNNPNAASSGPHTTSTLPQPEPENDAPSDNSETAPPGIAAPPPGVEQQSLQPQAVQQEPLH